MSVIAVRTVTPSAADARIEVSAILPDDDQDGGPVVEFRLCRRRPGAHDLPVLDPTPAGFRVPLHLAGELRDAIAKASGRAFEALAWGASTKRGRP